MEFKKREPIGTSDPYYDLFDGGYLKPKDFLVKKEDIKKVNEAIVIVRQYLKEGEEAGIIEMI